MRLATRLQNSSWALAFRDCDPCSSGLGAGKTKMRVKNDVRAHASSRLSRRRAVRAPRDEGLVKVRGW